MADISVKSKSPKPRILVVDDEWTVVELLNRHLSAKGYEVTTAYDGREAWALFKDQPFDLVLSDLRMPGFNGLQLLSAVKQANPRVPVVLVSGYGNVESVVQALKGGAENFLPKPLDLEELERVIEQSLAISCIRPGGSQIKGRIRQNTVIQTQSRYENIADIVYQISLSAVAVGFAEYDLDNNLKLALVEALTNAMEHGNHWDQAKLVTIEASLSRTTMEVTIEDQGGGFAHQNQFDPTMEENLLKERGRGLFILRAIMDEVRFNQPGNTMTLIKHRPSDQGNTDQA